MMPSAETGLRAGDELLLAGTPDARSELKLMLSHEHVLAYVLTGCEQPGGWVWETARPIS